MRASKPPGPKNWYRDGNRAVVDAGLDEGDDIGALADNSSTRAIGVVDELLENDSVKHLLGNVAWIREWPKCVHLGSPPKQYAGLVAGLLGC